MYHATKSVYDVCWRHGSSRGKAVNIAYTDYFIFACVAPHIKEYNVFKTTNSKQTGQTAIIFEMIYFQHYGSQYCYDYIPGVHITRSVSMGTIVTSGV